MTLKSLCAVAALSFACPALAHDGLAVTDAYARFLPGAKAGAAFMLIENHSETDDRLIGASSDIAARVETHTHKQGADGLMQMMHVPEGFAIPAQDVHQLERGGDHLMFMGLTRVPASGETISVTLTFEQAGEMTIEVPVDNGR